MAVPSRPLADTLWLNAVVGVLAALPTLVHAAWSPSFLVDDWGFALTARDRGLAGFVAGSDMKSRPFQALYHGVTFVGFGPRPVWHLILLAGLNAAAGVLVLRVARRWFDGRTSILVALSWVVLANRGASRLWISTGPTMVAMVLLLLAAWAASLERPRWVTAIVLVALSTLTYEGGVLLGMAVVLVACWRAPARTSTERRLRVLTGLAVVTAAACSVFVFSPKSSPTTGAPAAALPALFGTSLLPEQMGGARALVLVVIFGAGATAVLSELRRPGTLRLLSAGAVLTALGIAPFVATGFPLSTDGMLDRGNTFATFGVALLLAGALNQLWNLPGRVAVGGSAVLLVLLAAGNVTDVTDVRAAERDGEAALRAIAVLEVPPGTRVVLGPMPNRGGYAAFGYDVLAAAVEIRTGRVLDVHDTFDDADFESQTGAKYRFDPSNGALLPVPPSQAQDGTGDGP